MAKRINYKKKHKHRNEIIKKTIINKKEILRNIIHRWKNNAHKLKIIDDYKHILKKKMEKMEKEHNEQLKLITNYKNSELTTFQNVILQYKQYFKNRNINPKLNMPKERMNDKNDNLNYEKIMVEIVNKDKIIKSLNIKLEKYQQ